VSTNPDWRKYDRSVMKTPVPDRFKAWARKRAAISRETAHGWHIWEDVPASLRERWFRVAPPYRP
jgi:hypothetical protein